MSLWSGQYKALCIPPVILNMDWRLGERLNQQTPKNGDSRLLPNKWGIAAATSCSQCGIWGQKLGLGFPIKWEIMECTTSSCQHGTGDWTSRPYEMELQTKPRVRTWVLGRTVCQLKLTRPVLGSQLDQRLTWRKWSSEPRGCQPTVLRNDEKENSKILGYQCLCFSLSVTLLGDKNNFSLFVFQSPQIQTVEESMKNFTTSKWRILYNNRHHNNLKILATEWEKNLQPM